MTRVALLNEDKQNSVIVMSERMSVFLYKDVYFKHVQIDASSTDQGTPYSQPQ